MFLMKKLLKKSSYNNLAKVFAYAGEGCNIGYNCSGTGDECGVIGGVSGCFIGSKC